MFFHHPNVPIYLTFSGTPECSAATATKINEFLQEVRPNLVIASIGRWKEPDEYVRKGFCRPWYKGADFLGAETSLAGWKVRRESASPCLN